MSDGVFTVNTSERTTVHPVNGDGITVEEAINLAFPSGGFSWDAQRVRLGNNNITSSQAEDTTVHAGDVLTILSSGLASGGIKGN